jgi:hypothetical protein
LSRNASLRRCAVVVVATALGACAGPTSLQQVVARQQLPATVELTGTPFFAQTDYQCGPAALATLLGAAGAPVAPEALVAEIYLPGRRGSLQPEIVAAIRERAFVPYVVEQDLAALLGELDAGRPVLVLQRLGIGPWPAWHYAVLAGYDAGTGKLILRSGTEARRLMSIRQFMLTWDRAERWGVVALPAGVIPAAPNFMHYMTAVAGLESLGKARGAVWKAYEAASREWPDEPLTWLGIANMAAADADWVTAERGFSQAVARAPDDVAAHNNHAESLRRLGCVRAAQEAIASAQRLVAPGHPLHATVQATAADVAAAAASAAGTEPRICPN